MLAHGSHTIFADYFQFYLWDKDTDPEAPVDYSDDDVSNRIKTGPNVAVIQPVRNMEVPFEIEIHESDPGFDPDDWDHIAECSLELPSGHLEIHECTGGPIAEFSIPQGVYRVRALFGKLEELSDDELDGNDHYKATLWPSPYGELKVIKQWNA